jgi:hypothetical protein
MSNEEKKKPRKLRNTMNCLDFNFVEISNRDFFPDGDKY